MTAPVAPPPLPPLDCPPPLPPKRNHHQIFNNVLIALAALLAVAVAQFVILRANGQFQVEPWVFYYLVSINSLFLLAIIAALIARWRIPRMRRAITITIRCILLLSFPLGTVIGIYGLWKVDRPPKT